MPLNNGTYNGNCEGTIYEQMVGLHITGQFNYRPIATISKLISDSEEYSIQHRTYFYKCIFKNIRPKCGIDRS